MMYPKPFKRWWERPLVCLLGFHTLRRHPSGGGYVYCGRCYGERGPR